MENKLESNPWQKLDVQGLASLLQNPEASAEIQTDPEGWQSRAQTGAEKAAFLHPFNAGQFGDPRFKALFGAKYALYGGAMAVGIASEEMVIALGKAGMLGSFGAGGLSPARLNKAIDTIQAALPEGNYLFNLLNSPFEPAMEQLAVDTYLERGIKAIEASAYLSMTENLVRYRASGLRQRPEGGVEIGNKIIAKLSRQEVAERFMAPAPAESLAKLQEKGLISAEQAALAARVPMADAITAEADSGGHTDNRPLVSLLPSMLTLRDKLQKQYGYSAPVMIGAGGGVSTPEGALAAFSMGAAFVVTGSVNQASLEAGTSEAIRRLLADMAQTDVIMAPASDMFEMGTKVQVLKRGTMFPMRGLKLYELYSRYDSIEDIPQEEREKLEKSVFRMPLEAVWEECVSFFSKRDPIQLERAAASPKKKMALIFRWYLGLASHWATEGKAGREMDYQVWTGPSMGAFNDWTRGTYLEEAGNRQIADVNLQILQGAAYLQRVRQLEWQGLRLPEGLRRYLPARPVA